MLNRLQRYNKKIEYTNNIQQDTIQYSYDMRNMLTETRNRHFAERLFYADNLPQSATACYNGNIAALRIDQMDSVFTFTYTYDACNRLKTSNRLTGYGAMFSESFDYDDGGNILHLKRYKGSQLIDDLVYDYGNIGNQVRSISDNGQDADRYSIIEYHNGTCLSDTTMRYDANGNLTSDADRGIAFTRYNILNLPDTIQFNNGNQIINMYDAAGRKYKSITYTLPATAVAPIYEIAHYNYGIDTIHFEVTEYAGNIERRYSRIDTTQRVFNTIGYCQKDTFFYAIKDHLGNTNVIVNAATQLPVQSTVYYASGVPMAQSFGRDMQPYLYNGKEFVESHGYNTFDYGFRGYYAPGGRFTTVDPLAEQTPWQSPYSYAGNNYINAIDWMGLAGVMSGFTSTYEYVAVDENGIVLDFDLSHPDKGVYQVNDDNWDGTYWDLLRYAVIGKQVDTYIYRKGDVLGGGGIDKTSGGYYNIRWNYWVSYGTIPRDDSELLWRIFLDNPALVQEALRDCSIDVMNGLSMNFLLLENIKHYNEIGCISNHAASMWKKGIRGLTYFSAGVICYDIYTNGISSQSVSDAVVLALTEYLTYVALNNGITGLISFAGYGVLGAYMTSTSYVAAKGLTQISNDLYTRYGTYEAVKGWWCNYYWP